MTVTFDESEREENIVIRYLAESVEYVKIFANQVSEAMFVRVKDVSWSIEEQISVLMSVKESITKVDIHAE